MNHRQNIIQIEKKLFLEHKRAIDDSTAVTDRHFKKYWRHYKNAVKAYQKTCDLQSVLKACHDSRFVLVGDYHTLDQSQRSFVRMLRYFRSQFPKQKFVVALETLQNRHQKHLDDFLKNKITNDDFIKKIGFKKHWFFDLWKNYEIIFDFAKKNKVPCYAIDDDHRQTPDLKQRDAFMAKTLLQIQKQNPDCVVFVLVGDLHLAPKHLPLDIQMLAQKQNAKKPEVVSLYQNSPEIYWHLSQKGIVEHTEFVKIRKTEFCRMHTPPLIVQQSYLNWLYHEEGTFDWADAKSNFLNLVKQICAILDLRVPADVEDVEVHTCGDLSFLNTLKRKKIFTPSELKFIDFQIRHEESYFMPRARLVYIANVSIHHAAEEASHYLKFLLSGEEFPRSRKDAFYANVLHEALGFFGSKLINPKRKCPRYKDFVQQKRFLEKTGFTQLSSFEYETAVWFCEHWKLASHGNTLMHNSKIANMSSKLFLAVTHAIGYDLGDHLYFGFMNGRFSKQEFQLLFKDPFEDEGKPAQIYLNLFNRLKTIKRPQYL